MKKATLAGLACLLLMATSATQATTLTAEQKCEQSKLKAQGKLQACLAKNAAGMIDGKADAEADCRAKFQAALDKADTKAEAASTSCRFMDNGDGTVSDLDTGLVWEQKTGTIGVANPSDVHDVNNTYTLSTGFPWLPTGTAYTEFLFTLNGANSGDGLSTGGCFANHCDWRLPTVEEIRGIREYTQGVCAGGSGACVNPALGPTQLTTLNGETITNQYWTISTVSGNPFVVWPGVTWGGGSASVQKDQLLFARAVRGGL